MNEVEKILAELEKKNYSIYMGRNLSLLMLSVITLSGMFSLMMKKLSINKLYMEKILL